MLRISTLDKKGHRKLVLEGKLVEPWLAELRQTWNAAQEDLDGRKLIIDLTNVTVISHEGESALFEMMKQGAHFSCNGVLIRHMVKQLARRCGGKHHPPCSSHAND